ncbi:MAG: altronate dehydratase [Actinomycetia bacterium]|nr:altronate dehydratase [Actinomycetes bacterium]
MRLHGADNVVVARDGLWPGDAVPEEGLNVLGEVPAGHKVATAHIALGQPVHKYDQTIGFASREIRVGEHVHTQNLEFAEFHRDYAFGAARNDAELLPEPKRAVFQGFRRADGRVGTRNYIGVLTTVNCSATVARQIADHFRGPALEAFPNVDGVVALTHGWGCGMGSPEGHFMVQRCVGGYARHPNFAGIVMVGLGCEALQMNSLMESESLVESDSFRPFIIQDAGSRAAVDSGVRAVQEMLPVANTATREPIPAGELVLALECGGSDAYSGISANPGLGAAVDLLVSHGGTACLAETPEIYGAEHLLTRRAATREVGEKLVERIRWWEDYTARNNASLNNNPSPGNKAGGLTTILEKSLGAASKGGTTTLVDVYRYAEPITAKGLVFMDSPGYDPASVAGMIAGGANIACFTTGRGSVFGSKPVPCLKLATNSTMYRRMSDDMDINCGSVIDDEMTIEQLGRQIFELVLATASGEPTKSEEFGFGENEFVPWAAGAVL